MLRKDNFGIRLSKQLGIRVLFYRFIVLLWSRLLSITLKFGVIFWIRISEPIKMNTRKGVVWEIFLFNEACAHISFSWRNDFFGINARIWNEQSARKLEEVWYRGFRVLPQVEESHCSWLARIAHHVKGEVLGLYQWLRNETRKKLEQVFLQWSINSIIIMIAWARILRQSWEKVADLISLFGWKFNLIRKDTYQDSHDPLLCTLFWTHFR